MIKDGEPIVTCTFSGGQIEVEIENWEKLNARLVERMIRAVLRRRKQLITKELHKMNVEKMEQKKREEEETPEEIEEVEDATD